MNDALEAAIIECWHNFKVTVDNKVLLDFAKLPEDKLYRCHFGMGILIRNTLLRDGKLYNLFIENEILHIDDMSSMIINIWHKRLL